MGRNSSNYNLWIITYFSQMTVIDRLYFVNPKNKVLVISRFKTNNLSISNGFVIYLSISYEHKTFLTKYKYPGHFLVFQFRRIVSPTHDKNDLIGKCLVNTSLNDSQSSLMNFNGPFDQLIRTNPVR